MDPNRFDTLARSVTTATSRRAALAGLLAGLFAPVVADRDAEAKRHRRHDKNRHRAHQVGDEKNHKHKKKGKKKKKSPSCVPTCGGGKNCGSDGCSGTCGVCSGSQTCGGGGTPGVCGNRICTPNCAGQAACADDGCGNPCETCGAGESCVSGDCVPDSGSCTPDCTGGKDCQNGQCVCPPDKPHVAPEQYCNDTCRECCIDDHCGRYSGKQCDHNQGSICRCNVSDYKDCGNGFCVGCCTVEDCIVKYHYTNNVYCGAMGTPGAGSCHCDAGLTACLAEPYPTVTCTDLDTDSLNCGVCYNVCPEGFPLCRNGICRAA